MTFEEYMSEVLRYERMSLGEAENKFLFIIMGEPKSAYTVYSILKEQGRGIAYKNVYTKIKRLEELKLIKRVPGRLARRAINYGLTTQGLFFLLSQFASYKLRIDWERILDYYTDNIILRTLVMPYFEIATLRSPEFNLYHSMLTYIRNCYLITLDGCDYIRQFVHRRHGQIIQIFGDQLVDIDEPADNIGPDYTVKSAINSLKKELEWEAKEMAFTLITKPTSSFSISLARFGTTARFGKDERAGKGGVEPKQLGKDKRFMKLLCEVQKDFDRGFKAADAAAKQGK
jgi:DNA-binding MarR family transcriptional regulator